MSLGKQGVLATVLALGLAGSATRAQETQGEKSPDLTAIEAIGAAYVAAFDAAKADDLAALFLTDAEVVDEAGNILRGREEIAKLYRAFFEAFPGVTMTREVESTRLIGKDLAIEDGVMIRKVGEVAARNRYMAVLARADGDWRIATARELAEDLPPTARERLEPLAWIIGEWVNEDSESVVTIRGRWDESEAFLLLDYDAKIAGVPSLKSQQRIGFDPLTQQFRSWVFDSDGGYGEAYWTSVEGEWVVKSTSVLPDGETGSATFYIIPDGPDRFTWKAFDRIRSGEIQPDVTLTITRKPPQPTPEQD